MNCRRIFWLALVATTFALAGCVGIWSDYDLTANPGQRFQPAADGPAAVFGAITVIPNLHLAYASHTTGAPAAFGPGIARLNGTILEAFSLDGDLNPVQTAGSQPGFFERPATSLFGGLGYNITGTGGSDELIVWGRWTGDFLTLVTRGNVAPGPFFYVVGQLTPATQLPQSGLAWYSFLGTKVGPEDPIDFDATDDRRGSALSVLWGASTTKVGLQMYFLRYGMQTSGGIDTPSGVQQSELTLRPGTATFGGSNIPFSRCPQGSTCAGTVEGFFAGPNAERAGVAVQVRDSGAGRPDELISGVFAFAFSQFLVPPTPTPPAPFTPAPLDPAPPGPLTVVRAGGPADSPASLSPLGVFTQNQTTFAVDRFGQAPFTNELARGTAQSADVGGDALITWGRWTNGSYDRVQSFGNAPVALGAEQGLHYVIGGMTPTPNIPGAGTAIANFSLMGATKPTFGDGAMAAGTFSGAIAVSWGGASATKVGMNFTVTMPGDSTYVASTSGALSNPAASQVGTLFNAQFFGTLPVVSPGRACASNPGACNVNVSGFFAGPAAERAGIAYQIGSGNAQQSIYGVAAFAKQ